MQLVNPLKTPSRQFIREQNTNSNSLALYDHHFVKKKQVYSFAKFNSKELYNILILGIYKKPMLQGYFEAFLESTTIHWKIFICYHVRLLLTQNIAHLNIKF